ncbi:hypothetical protein CaCOL14_005632 [Colletotrichum acutatum]
MPLSLRATTTATIASARVAQHTPSSPLSPRISLPSTALQRAGQARAHQARMFTASSAPSVARQLLTTPMRPQRSSLSRLVPSILRLRRT